jgi:hypothetical protein
VVVVGVRAAVMRAWWTSGVVVQDWPAAAWQMRSGHRVDMTLTQSVSRAAWTSFRRSCVPRWFVHSSPARARHQVHCTAIDANR